MFRMSSAVSNSVIPKPVLIAPPQHGGTLAVRYFVPHQCHLALAITGAVAIATACCTPGTLAAQMTGPISLPTRLTFEHPLAHRQHFASP
jgi:2-methylaconitate cis-trans-isomerase PrpF